MRQCGSCNICCEGWFGGDINGHKLQIGNPCPHKQNSGCSIHEKRPELCRQFNCIWLERSDIFDESLRPDKTRTIGSRRWINDLEFVLLREASKPLDPETLSIIFTEFYKERIKNLIWQVGEKWYIIGSPIFVEQAQKYMQAQVGSYE